MVCLGYYVGCCWFDFVLLMIVFVILGLCGMFRLLLPFIALCLC